MNTIKKNNGMKNLNKNSKLNLINKKISKNQTIIPYQVIDFMSRFSIQFWKEFYKKTMKKRSTFLIDMQLRNEKKDTFTVATDQRYFTYKGGVYYLDSDFVRDDIHSGLSSLFYHQDCSIPFKINIDIAKLNQSVNNTKDGEMIEKAINPTSLKGFINSQVIEKILKGEELSRDMDFMKKLIIINLLISAVIGLGVGKAIGWI